LILTHTHAGVDAIRERLKKHKVEPGKFRINTIAGWCLRYAAAFPQRSQIAATEPKTSTEWTGVYKAATRLLGSGAVSGVLPQSYGGVFVDEY
jgi:DNA helicase-2/ATP-dependent DNA helicase PcrA